ncbi:hydroxyacid dehydrogenase [Skermania sp. ID1734]|uniref:D-isomer specific 2-hydroxyacid dehydrogenase family protein n=1 Tax=Skermania sp. ID1734 TaxID=2597516 RepID=UPI00117F1992|nr:D-isomer specific 2-hydroxyacid dehydrogenase family protein [Skermania sp. ID1734]TSE00018.1 hydroxyacid dehydrogenase [Skermania sp. ID1734]
MTANSIALEPSADPDVAEAIVRAGGELADLDSARGLVWLAGAEGFPDLGANIEWVQLAAAGVEDFFTSGVIGRSPNVQFTSAAGAYSRTVAEHALALLLAGVRAIPDHLRARSWQQQELAGRIGTLRDSTVTIIGAGGIGRTLIPMLAALGAHAIAVSRSGKPVPGAVATYPIARLPEVWPETDHIVISAPATPATRHLVGADELGRLKPHSWVINVARGSLLDTDALIAALRSGVIGGAGLDVTDPEPLPDGHPLWDLPNVIITPHDSNPPSLRRRAFADHVGANVARFVNGCELLARVDPVMGY